jgi:capsular polysaccharide export protein
VLENGYLRPHWVTFERNGVNGFSGLPKDRNFYLEQLRELEALNPEGDSGAPQSFPFRLRYQVLNTIKHFAAATALFPFLPFDAKYYGDSVFRQAVGYTSEYLWRKTHSETRVAQQVRDAKLKDGRSVFTVLMQKPGDGQLVVHSRYGGNRGFLTAVVASFARSAPADAFLVVKQHPLDYGVDAAPAFARKLFKDYGVADRAAYLRKTNLDICMDHSVGLVTVNSTGGIAALRKGLAVKCMGEAVYDVEGLTYQGDLDEFWVEGKPPEPKLLQSFVRYLIHTSQLNGGFHSRRARNLLVKRLALRLLKDSAFPHHAREHGQACGPAAPPSEVPVLARLAAE